MIFFHTSATKSRPAKTGLFIFFGFLWAAGSVWADDLAAADAFARAVTACQRGRFAAAVECIDSLLLATTEADLTEKAMLLKAECLLRDRRDLDARRTLALAQRQFTGSRYAPRTLYWYGVALIRTGEYLKGAQALVRVLESNSGPVLDSLARAGLRLFVDGRATDFDLIEIERSAGSPGMAAAFRYERAQKLQRAGKAAEAQILFESFLRDFPNDPRGDEVRGFLKGSTDTSGAFPVALLVPLEGEYKEVGSSVRNGVELAMDQWHQAQSRRMALQRIDTKGDVVTTVLAVQDLVRENRVRAVIGPVLTQEVVAAAAAVGTSGIPMITPTATGERITKVCPTLYQIPASPSMLCRRLARYAKETMRIEEFVILSPLTDYGRVMSEAFKQSVAEIGGKCTAVQYYPEGETNFRRLFQEIRRRKLHRSKKGPAPEEVIVWTDSLLDDEKSRDKDTTEVFAGGIFLPCGPDEATALASQAGHYRIHGQLLGTPSWYSPDAIRRSKEAVEGSIICMDFLPEANPAAWRDFSQSYQTRYGIRPDKVAGQAYDTARMLCKVLEEVNEGAGAADVNNLARSFVAQHP